MKYYVHHEKKINLKMNLTSNDTPGKFLEIAPKAIFEYLFYDYSIVSEVKDVGIRRYFLSCSNH